MNPARFLVAVLVACVVAVVVSVPAAGQGGAAHVSLPADLAGIHEGVAYRIRVPAGWNGTLLVHTHGTRLSGAGPVEPEVAPQPYPIPAPSLEEQLLARGYALAGAEYANSIEDGTKASHALTTFFNGAIGSPARVVAWGCSLGGTVAATLLEKYPGIYDGAISCAGPLAGQAKNVDASLVFALAYDVAFGWRADLWGPVEDLRDDLVSSRDVAPYVQWPTPERRGKWEFIRLVTKLPTQAFWGADPQVGVPFFGMQMWRATEVRSRVEAEYRGRVAQNLDHHYTLTDAEKGYLAGLGVDANALLDQMNARTNIEADPSSRILMERGGLDGRLTRPLIAIHSAYDGVARTANESAFLAEVEQAGTADRLVQAFTSAPGHCSFSTAQYLAALDAMEHWLNTGERPDAAFFPTGAGFLLGFAPPMWPF